MNYLKLFIALLITLSFSISCSTIRTHKQAENLSSIRGEQSYRIRVRSGNLALDKLIYELAYMEVGKHLPVSEKGPHTGFVDIVFTSTSKTAFRESTAGFTTNVAYGNNWFTGDDTLWITGNSAAINREIAPGGTFTWQNSTMVLTIKNVKNKKLWTADFSYKGGRDLSGLYINTADEAAKFCLNKIVEQFEIEYVLNPQITQNKIKGTMSNTVLIVKSKKSPLQEVPVYRAKRIPPNTALIVRSKSLSPQEVPVYKVKGIMPKAPITVKNKKTLFQKAPSLGRRGYLDK